jgi:L-aspartate oxidase
MEEIDPLKELAPRDVVARAVFAETLSGRGAFLDCREAIGAAFPERFPTVHAACLKAGIDPVREPIPVAPAEHYHMGGVLTDANGRTSLDNLWAAGEVASTGAHGANRLASNSLLETVVFAARIAEDIQNQMPNPRTAHWPGIVDHIQEPTRRNQVEREAIGLLRRAMAAGVGVIRDADGLTATLAVIDALEARCKRRSIRNMMTTCKAVTASALMRRESRGGHWRSDFPQTDPAFARRSFFTLRDVEAAVVAARDSEVGRAAVARLALESGDET